MTYNIDISGGPNSAKIYEGYSQIKQFENIAAQDQINCQPY